VKYEVRYEKYEVRYVKYEENTHLLFASHGLIYLHRERFKGASCALRIERLVFFLSKYSWEQIRLDAAQL
jgi:hypothetical protein